MFILNRFNKGISLFKRIKKTLKNAVIGDKWVMFFNPYPTMTGLKKPELYVKDEDWTFFAQCILLNNLHPSGL